MKYTIKYLLGYIGQNWRWIHKMKLRASNGNNFNALLRSKVLYQSCFLCNPHNHTIRTSLLVSPFKISKQGLGEIVHLAWDYVTSEKEIKDSNQGHLMTEATLSALLLSHHAVLSHGSEDVRTDRLCVVIQPKSSQYFKHKDPFYQSCFQILLVENIHINKKYL